MEQVLTVDEAAEHLKVRPETIRRLLSQGKLPGNKIGRAWRIPEGALMKFLRREDHEPVMAGSRLEEPVWIE